MLERERAPGKSRYGKYLATPPPFPGSVSLATSPPGLIPPIESLAARTSQRRHGFGRAVHVSSVVAVAHSVDGSAVDEYAEWNGAELGAPPGGGSVLGVRDAAIGTRLALEAGASGRRYILGESYHGIRDLLRLGARCLAIEGLPAREPRATVPSMVWPALVAGSRRLARFRPPKRLTPQTLRMLGCRWRLSSDRARRELGWRPRPFEDVLFETIRDLRAAGDL